MSPQRLKQLEAENAALAKSLAQVCDENASLIHQVVSLEEKTVELAQAPLKQTSVLRSLYEPSKSGWFGGSKSTTREQLEKLTEALQNEFMEYKSSHASSNEEFSALMSELKRSTAHAAELGKVIHDQQQRLSVATSAAHHHDDMSRRSSTTADPDGYEEEVKGLRKQCAELSTQLLKAQQQIKTSDGELARIRKELRSVSEGRDALKAEVSQHQFDAEFDRSKAEADVLRKEVEQLREALAAEERLHGLKSEESAKRAARIEELTATHAEEIQALKQSLQAEKAHSSSSDCPNCARTHQDLLALQDQLEESRKNAVAARSQLAETTSVHEQRFAAMEAKMLETQAHLDEKESQIAHSVTADAYAQVQADNKRLNHELTLRQSRITHLETLQKSSSTTSSPSMKGIMVGGTELDEAEVIETIDALNERVSRLEFERDEVKSQMEQAKTFAVERNEEAQRAERSAAEEKQRVAFLVQKCAATKSELTALTLTCEGLTEGLDKCKRELKQQTRVAEELPALRTKHEELTKEKQVLEGRVESTKQLEDKLVQAKETIAYMELAQSRTINMSQYAELEAERDRMRSSMEPLTRRLEETTKEVERLRNVTEAQQTVSNTQQTAVQNFKDQVEVLTDSECKMRESVATLSAENSRLQKLNASLEAQMNDMQDGIKEMAVHMDRERGNARIAAEAAQQKEVDDLRAQLAKATATLAEVEASRGEQVSEGLYKSVVNERTSLTNDLAKTQGEVERLKSEILIYRQTILDLEAENDEHVKELESMQERLQTDRSGLGDKLASEQHKISEISNELEVLKEEYAAKEKLCEEQKASITSLEEKQIAQQRAFENRCRSDEPLNDRIAMLTTSLEEARGTEATLHSQLTAAQEALEAERTQVEELKHQVAVAEEAKSAALAERDVPDADENAREHLERENASLREEVERLRLVPVPVATPISTPPPEVAKSPDMAGLPPAPRSASAAKKLKKVPKKKRSLAEQMNESDEVDVLAAPAAVTATSEATETDASRLQQAQANLSRAQREVESLSMQNATLKEKISQMTNTHQQWQQDMSAQQAKYRSELEALQSNQGAAAAISAHQSKSGSSEAELKKATKQLRQKDAEIKAISDQLLPTKGKLAAYMAVTDRLGISYPFPDDVARVVLQHLQPTGLTNGRRAHRSQRDDIAEDSLR